MPLAYPHRAAYINAFSSQRVTLFARQRPVDLHHLQPFRNLRRVDKRHGARVRYANPFNGGWALPTMGAHLALLPNGFKGEDYRSTDGTIFVCVEGKGSTKIGDELLEWGPNDIFVTPPWKPYAHSAAKDSVLFAISDRPAQEALGIWREAKSAA